MCRKERKTISSSAPNNTSTAFKKLTLILSLAIVAFLVNCSRSRPDGDTMEALYNEVDDEIARRELYMVAKEHKLDSLRNLLQRTHDIRGRLDLSNRLVEEYEAYLSDSALYYVNLSLALARELEDAREHTRLQIKKSDIASHAGLFSEAHTLLGEIPRHELDSALLPYYYAAFSNLYQYETEYLPEGEYSARTSQLRDVYTDSLIKSADRNSFEYISNRASDQINHGNYAEAKRFLEDHLKNYSSGDRRYSILASILAYLYKMEGNDEMHHRYLAMTVISDIKGAVKENMAIRELATEVFENGDIERANRYLKASFDDANFYAARMRNAQSSRMLPVIDKAYDNRQQRLQNSLTALLIVVSALFLTVMAGVFKIYSQMKRIAAANKEIKKNNEALSEMSEKLKEMNRELKNSNRITEEYAGLFMEYCSLNINDLQKYHNALRKLAVQGNVKGILKKLDSGDVASDTLKTFYSKFDEAILNIYPSFVTKVNSLMRPEEAINVKPGEKLNTELRILALIRIGINDSEKIAEFLRCSIATVYTYRSKIKRRAIDPDTFESDFLSI